VFLVLTYVNDLLINMAINTYMTAAATILQNKPSICLHRPRDTHPPIKPVRRLCGGGRGVRPPSF
jgi:hypothetical protein